MPNNNISIHVSPGRPILSAEAVQTVDVLVKISPVSQPPGNSRRPKLNIGIALDRSGSMGGEKMQRAREAAIFLTKELSSTDRFAAVIFDDQVDTLITSQHAENKDFLRRSIERIEARGSTALHEGWRQAGLEVSEYIDPSAINRVILITDGLANVGLTDPDRIVDHARGLAEKGVTTSTIGIGRDFNEDLLLRMAEAAGGNGWYVQEPEDMARIFETELSGLLRLIGESVKLEVEPAAGVRVVEVLNDFETDGSGRFVLPNLQAGSPLKVVFRLSVPPREMGTSLDLAAFRLHYTLQGTDQVEAVSASCSVTFDSADAAAAVPANVAVVEAVQMLINARARREMVDAIDRGDRDGAHQVLFSVATSSRDLARRYTIPDLDAEADELDDIGRHLNTAERAMLARKRGIYGRDRIRKGKGA
ncbi:MAG: VWA domain-containing protein [Pyrinomonadaceae bacterium]